MSRCAEHFQPCFTHAAIRVASGPPALYAAACNGPNELTSIGRLRLCGRRGHIEHARRRLPNKDYAATQGLFLLILPPLMVVCAGVTRAHSGALSDKFAVSTRRIMQVFSSDCLHQRQAFVRLACRPHRHPDVVTAMFSTATSLCTMPCVCSELQVRPGWCLAAAEAVCVAVGSVLWQGPWYKPSC